VSERGVRARVSLPVAAWIVILILTGGFQFYRGAVADGCVFIAMAVALVLDLTGAFPAFRSREWRPSRIITVLVLAGAAAVLALTPRHGLPDEIVLIVSGVLVFLVAWPDHEPRSGEAETAAEVFWTARMRRTAALWAGVGIAFCLWELSMYFLGTYVDTGRDAFPALSDLLNPLLQNPVGRVIFVAAWLLGGVALARRGRER
jgi:hypothetical protein